MTNKKQEKRILIRQPTLPLFSVPWWNRPILKNNQMHRHVRTGVNGWPCDIINVISVVLKGVKRAIFFEAPQLDGPIDRWGQEEVAEVNRTRAMVSTKTRDRRTLVPLKVIKDT